MLVADAFATDELRVEIAEQLVSADGRRVPGVPPLSASTFGGHGDA